MNSNEYKIYMEQQISKMKANYKAKKHAEITKLKKAEGRLKKSLGETVFAAHKYQAQAEGKKEPSYEDLINFYKKQIEKLKA